MTASGTQRDQADTGRTPQPGTGPAAGSRAGTRPEIQALRAVAVALVVFYHFWPERLPGGFIGVDVFFVISGFLITAHLVRDVAARGRVQLATFWARRARRLLPASLLVLLVTSIAVLVVVPSALWRDIFGEITASTLYVQNWFLASSAVDYSAADALASPVQHYWSLSTEEQFYLVWPVLIAIIALLSKVLRPGRTLSRTAVLAGLGIVVAASLAFSIYYTGASPDAAYFITPTRAWQFGAGGLLAVALPGPLSAREGARQGLLSLLSIAGLVALVAAALAYSTETPFPGSAALLPVLGTLAVIAAGTPRAWFSPARIAGLAPVQFLGDISYSVYLWHWPLLIITPFLLQRDAETGLGTTAKLALLLATVLLAWLTKIAVEDPVRSARFLTRRRPALSLVAAAAGMAIVLAIPLVTTAGLDAAEARSDAIQKQLVTTPELVTAPGSTAADVTRSILASLPECLGALAKTSGGGCSNPGLDDPAPGSIDGPAGSQGIVIPDPTAGKIPAYRRDCLDDLKKEQFLVCELGVPEAKATKTVAVIGDSHAFSLLPTIMTIAEAQGWHVVSVTRGSCPFNDATRALEEGPARDGCVAWNDNATQLLRDRPEISAVFTSASAKNGYVGADGRTGYENAVAGASSLWRSLPTTVTDVVVVRDVPRARVDVIECLDEAYAGGDLSTADCSSPEDEVKYADPLADAAKTYSPQPGEPVVTLVDPTPVLCTAGDCVAYLGHTIVYRDSHHIAPVFARTLAPLVQQALPTERFAPR